jgi:hypothetical protein
VPDRTDSKLKLVAGNGLYQFQKMITNGTKEVEMSQCVAGIKGTTFVCEETGSKLF